MTLEEIYKQIPKSTCPPGCGKCCGLLFPSLKELQNINSWLKAHGRPFVPFSQTEGLDCPYLAQDKTCSIYPVRPYLCRIMGVSEDTRLNCREGCKPCGKMLNRQTLSYLYTQIYLTGKETQRTLKHKKWLNKLLAGMV